MALLDTNEACWHPPYFLYDYIVVGGVSPPLSQYQIALLPVPQLGVRIYKEACATEVIVAISASNVSITKSKSRKCKHSWRCTLKLLSGVSVNSEQDLISTICRVDSQKLLSTGRSCIQDQK